MSITVDILNIFVTSIVALGTAITFLVNAHKRRVNAHRRTEEGMKEWSNQQFASRNEIADMKERIIKLETKIDHQC